jgi:hypothetical protein
MYNRASRVESADRRIIITGIYIALFACNALPGVFQRGTIFGEKGNPVVAPQYVYQLCLVG